MPRLKSSLVMCNVPTVDGSRAQAFYGALIGTDEFAPGRNPNVQSYWTPISRAGIDLTLTQRYDDQERVTPYFAVDDLDEAITQLVELGGEVVQRAESIPDAPGSERKKLGRMAVLLDPDRNHVGIIEIDDPEARRHFRADDKDLDDDQVEDLKQGMAVARGRD